MLNFTVQFMLFLQKKALTNGQVHMCAHTYKSPWRPNATLQVLLKMIKYDLLTIWVDSSGCMMWQWSMFDVTVWSLCVFGVVNIHSMFLIQRLKPWLGPVEAIACLLFDYLFQALYAQVFLFKWCFSPPAASTAGISGEEHRNSSYNFHSCSSL